MPSSSSYGCPFLYAECRIYYGSVLTAKGRWAEAEPGARRRPADHRRRPARACTTARWPAWPVCASVKDGWRRRDRLLDQLGAGAEAEAEAALAAAALLLARGDDAGGLRDLATGTDALAAHRSHLGPRSTCSSTPHLAARRRRRGPPPPPPGWTRWPARRGPAAHRPSPPRRPGGSRMAAAPRSGEGAAGSGPATGRRCRTPYEIARCQLDLAHAAGRRRCRAGRRARPARPGRLRTARSDHRRRSGRRVPPRRRSRPADRRNEPAC